MIEQLIEEFITLRERDNVSIKVFIDKFEISVEPGNQRTSTVQLYNKDKKIFINRITIDNNLISSSKYYLTKNHLINLIEQNTILKTKLKNTLEKWIR